MKKIFNHFKWLGITILMFAANSAQAEDELNQLLRARQTQADPFHHMITERTLTQKTPEQPTEPAVQKNHQDEIAILLEQQLQQYQNDPLYELAIQNPQGASAVLNAKAALVMNANSGEILYQKNIDQVRSIASISKLMAAMVILDANLNMDEVITITPAEIDRIKGTGSRLSIGTSLSRQQMMHLGLMSSENRAIAALGRTYPGGMAAFVTAMNAKAASLGMNQSRFFEPTGLDPRNTSTARDLARLVKAANNYPQIRQWSTATSGAAYTAAGKIEQYQNSNALVREGKWDISVQKTGYIRESGRSVVFQAQMSNQPLIFVVLGSASSTTRVNDARELERVIQHKL